MVKQKINLYIEDDLVKEAKEIGMNISAFLTEILSQKFKERKLIDIDFLIVGLKEKTLFAQKTIEKLQKRKEELIIGLKNRQDYLQKKYNSFPEIQNLTTEQLLNGKFLMSLIDIIESKYNQKASIAEIREYFQLKGDEK